MKNIIYALLMLLCLPALLVAQERNTRNSDEEEMFRQSFTTILEDMDNEFENVKGEESIVINDEKDRFEAKVYLYGMRNFINESDIICDSIRCRYVADFGPYFNTEDVENKETELLSLVKKNLGDNWEMSKLKSGVKFQSVESPRNDVSLYRYYGDGSGIFVRVLFVHHH